MEVIYITYQRSLLDNTLNGRIRFVDKKGKEHTKDYVLNQKIGQFMVVNKGTDEQPSLKVVPYVRGL